MPENIFMNPEPASLGKFSVLVSSNKPFSEVQIYVFIFFVGNVPTVCSLLSFFSFCSFSLFVHINARCKCNVDYCKHESKIVKYRSQFFFEYAAIVCKVLPHTACMHSWFSFLNIFRWEVNLTFEITNGQMSEQIKRYEKTWERICLHGIYLS